MESQKVMNLLNEASDSRFVTRNWNIVNDQSRANYSAGNEFINNIELSKFNLCHFNDPYVLVKDTITVSADNSNLVAFKNCALFTKCISKIDGTTIDDAEDLDLVMST